MSPRKILAGAILLLVALSIGVYFYLDSPRAMAKLMEPQCYLTVAGWLGERPAAPARPPLLIAGQAPSPVINEAFDRAYYEIVARYGGFQQGGAPLVADLQIFMNAQMPAPFPQICRRIALRVAKTCRHFHGDRRFLGECFAQNLSDFRYGLGRFHQGYLDDPELRRKVEDAHQNFGF